MIRISGLRMSLNYTEETLKKAVSKKLRISPELIDEILLVKRSVDARNKNDIFFGCTVDVNLGNAENRVLSRISDNKVCKTIARIYELPVTRKLEQRPVVVGFGPAGMFAALVLAQCGQRPIIIERGQCVEEREKTVNGFWESGKLNMNSNVQFGEGGAGTFSDGKLTTGTKDIRIQKVFAEFVKAGAPPEILFDAKPHIGTDNLPGVVKNIREEIKTLGGEIHFDTIVTDIVIKNGAICALKTENCNGQTTVECANVIFAVGHSARDTFEMLKEKGAAMEPKQFSVGARIEHPRELIDKSQYGKFAGNEALGTAVYKLSSQLKSGRGVYTFCMCPGGVVTGAASELDGVVTNGMSTYKRDAQNSNSALLVGVTPKDFGSDDVLAGIEFQRKIEAKAFLIGGSNYSAPAQRVGDFLNNRKSTTLGGVNPSYKPGVAVGNIRDCLPEYITDSMYQGINIMGRSLKGFDLPDAILTAPETRSSSPVRILRDEKKQSLSINGFYPCGEGAGYAGGIVSAAVDGIRCAEAIMGIFR